MRPRHLALILCLAAALAHGAPAMLPDIAYGSDARQRFDVYLPAAGVAVSGRVIFMVHGGGWRIGSRRESAVVGHKAPYFTGRGDLFISIDYRMLPDADPLAQARDVALALATAQRRAADWGGDRRRFVLMGHSAGAHLVALLAANPALAPDAAWLGAVALDSGAFDVSAIMRAPHLPLYDQAFGRDPDFWRRASPAAVLQPGARPMLLVCSSRRRVACPQAQAFARRVQASGARAEVLALDMGHREINLALGEDAAYTRAVQAFIDSLAAQ